MSQFKKKYPFDKRKEEASRITKKYTDRIPVIIDVIEKNTKDLHLDKFKYLVSHDLTVGQFLYVIRNRIKLEPEKAVFILFNNKCLPTSEIIGNIYKTNKDSDGFLYAMISLENTFG